MTENQVEAHAAIPRARGGAVAAAGAGAVPPVPAQAGGGGGANGAVAAAASPVGRIAGLSVLKGLVLYGATLAFAGLYAYFMEEIVSASKSPPHLNTAMVAAAAALAGILGSAFALVTGTPVRTTNGVLGNELAEHKAKGKKPPKATVLWRALSLEPAATDAPSWPQTFGIWMYAAVASAVALVYVLDQAETPPGIKALAVAFGGYVIALMTAAYGIGSSRGR